MKKSSLVILICVFAFGQWGCDSGSKELGTVKTDLLDYAPLEAELAEARAVFCEDLAPQVPGSWDLLELRTLLEEVELMLTTRSAISQKEIDATTGWLAFRAAEIARWEPQELPEPYPLLETGNQVVEAPEGVEEFYTKYTNAYKTDPTQGIPVVAPPDVPDEYLLKMREVINVLLRKRPDIRATMVDQHFSMGLGVSEEEFDQHPDRNFKKLQEIDRYDGIDEFCPLEEFLHLMQGIGMQKADPEIAREIIDAYKSAMERGGVFDPWGTIGSEDEWELMHLTAEDFATDESRRRLYLSPKIVSSFVVDEYFALGVCTWHGNVYPDEYLLATREEIGEMDASLDEIIRRYFVDDEWQCARSSR